MTRAAREALNRELEIAEPPFWGPRVIARAPVQALLPYLNERMLFQFHWGFRKEGRKLDDYMVWARKELRPVLKRMVDTVIQQDIMVPQAVYGYWKAAGEGDDLVLFGEDGAHETARFTLPRQAGEDGKCIADYVPDISAGPDGRGVVGLQVVTMGQRAADVAREWFEDDRYQDYLYLHGLGVELAEAMAEYVHKRIRAELGHAAGEASDMEGIAEPAIFRLALFLRLSGLPEPGGPGPAVAPAGRRRHRRGPVGRAPAPPGNVDLRPRHPAPEGEVFFGVRE